MLAERVRGRLQTAFNKSVLVSPRLVATETSRQVPGWQSVTDSVNGAGIGERGVGAGVNPGLDVVKARPPPERNKDRFLPLWRRVHCDPRSG